MNQILKTILVGAVAVTINGHAALRCGPEMSWRVVHDGQRVINLFEASGYTTTIYHLTEFTSGASALEWIAEKGLIYEPFEEDMPAAIREQAEKPAVAPVLKPAIAETKPGPVYDNAEPVVAGTAK